MQNPYKLRVGIESPYYTFADHKESTLTFDANGKVISITGPYDEVYAKTSEPSQATLDVDSIVGDFVNIEYA